MEESIDNAYEVRYSDVFSRDKPRPNNLVSKHVFSMKTVPDLGITVTQFKSTLVKLSEKIKDIREALFEFYNPVFSNQLRLIESFAKGFPRYDDNVMIKTKSSPESKLCTLLSTTFVVKYDKYRALCTRNLPAFPIHSHPKFLIQNVIVSQSDAELTIETTFNLICMYKREE
jgi:hypothetical protein